MEKLVELKYTIAIPHTFGVIKKEKSLDTNGIKKEKIREMRG